MKNSDLVTPESPPVGLYPSEADQKNWEMVDSDLRVVSSTLEGLPTWVKDQFTENTQWDAVEKLTFFYQPVIDVVVLNRSHDHADLYELLVTTYLSADDDQRHVFKDEAPVDCIETALSLLDYIVEKRRDM